MKRFSPSMAALLIILLLAFGALVANPARTLAASPNSAGQTAPTPAPETAQPGSTRGASPILGVLILLAPAAYMIWKSRGQKQPEIKGASCLPVIDETKRPFQPLEDEEISNDSREQKTIHR